jgi:DNA-binding transcriptional MerR regulator
VAVYFARKHAYAAKVVAWFDAVRHEAAASAWSGCVALAEYRLEELAEISGVSARNIRAYRERGLLDPPRRVGRSAFYDDYHLSQLRTINQLLRRGFNSAHIAEFFASMREGADLADILGIQRAVLGPGQGPETPEERPSTPTQTDVARRVVDVEPESDEARRLVEHGLAELVDSDVILIDPRIGEIVGRTSDQLHYVRALLHIHEATRDAIDGLAAGFVQALEEFVEARFGKGYQPKPHQIGELSRVVQDYRDLWSSVVSDRLDKSLHRQMASAGSDVTASVLLRGQRESH